MKTDDLIRLLAYEAGPAPQAAVARRLVPAALAALAVAVLLVLVFAPLVPMRMFHAAGWWLKLLYAAALAAGAIWAAARLSRPGLRADRPIATLAGVAGVMAAIALAEQLQMPEGDRMAAWLGHSWRTCPRNVLLLSLPALALALWAVRGLAPTDARRAGLACGLMAGGLGAMAYTLTCTEISPSFVVTWYSVGIAGAGALGALLGPRVLRW